ncbi:MAG TPA: beta-ketoacyl synthase chain length factor [Rudaea sp.]|nr:beta-ketoacyl synthase chain length factor [Rudaea sp.]
MNRAIEIAIAGIGIWSPEARNWDEAIAALCRNVEIAPNSTLRPTPSVLPPTERRRAPESVLLGVDVAQQACEMAGIVARDLPHVFASSYGDLPINDYLCETLAQSPLEVSPIRFHNSVHNAPAGYWAIATGCTCSSTAISAGDWTFGAGLLETSLVAASTGQAALLAAYDVPAAGALRDVVACDSKFAVGMVLATQCAAPVARIRIALDNKSAAELASDASVLHASHRDNPAARSLGILQSIARKEPGVVRVPAGPHLTLDVEILPWWT